jgi:hypothetical protein
MTVLLQDTSYVLSCRLATARPLNIPSDTLATGYSMHHDAQTVTTNDILKLNHSDQYQSEVKINAHYFRTNIPYDMWSKDI